ncbi:hypothetical protein CL656_03340 [bacterium]|nr:hypothetical protein [bacterium]|tara:strand:+ start:5351 stop:6379 length:1029 start_codon:yes stop_codon:yes gene_type:complete
MDILILGATSNICATRVFDNLNDLQHEINTIYCYDMKNITPSIFNQYFLENVKLNNKNMIINKIKYIYGNFKESEYINKIIPLMNQKLLIYVAIPPFCYNHIIDFFNVNNNFYKLILEKPLALNYNCFNSIKTKITNKMFIIDHFLYKKDIQNIIHKNKDKCIKTIKIKFLYENDVENRLGYFDTVGFFIDMFQSHYLSILYSLIGINKTKQLLNMNIKNNIRKQYKNYGGHNNVDTYFYVELNNNDTTYVFEGGKAMFKEIKEIQINENIYKINNYNDEYKLFFEDIIHNKVNESFIQHHDLFWKITEYINNDTKRELKIKYYDKNNKFTNKKNCYIDVIN